MQSTTCQWCKRWKPFTKVREDKPACYGCYIRATHPLNKPEGYKIYLIQLFTKPYSA